MKLLFMAIMGALGSAMGLSIKGDVRAFTTEHDGTVHRSFVIGKKLDKLKLEHSQELHVAVDLDKSAEGFKAPQQAFLRLRHQASGVSAFIPGSLLSNGTVTWKASSSFIAKQIGTYGEDFAAAILLGGHEETGVRVELGSVFFLHTPLPTGAQPPQPEGQAVVSNAQPRPEIIHQHRPADRRPPMLMSLVFTGLTLVPLALLIAYLRSIGANMKLFQGSVAASGLVFHGFVGSMIVLYSLFWLRLNLVQTLPWVGILGLATAVSGYVHLNNVSTARAKTVKGSKAE